MYKNDNKPKSSQTSISKAHAHDKREPDLKSDGTHWKNHFEQLLNAVQSINDLQNLKSQYVGKNSNLAKNMSNLKNISSAEEKKQQGLFLNHLLQDVNASIEKRRKEIERSTWLQKIKTQHTHDVTLESRDAHLGSMHPISAMSFRVNQVLQSLGFKFINAPYMDDIFYNFEALNMPLNHPARQEMCSFYLKNNNQTLLRTHATNAQIHWLENNKQPCKIFNTGQVFRNDSDRTHNPIFHQNDVLYMDEKVSMQDLISTVRIFFSRVLYEYPNLRLRIRPSYFPFTEPSAEVDIWHDNQWLEVMGCGMMHPNVFRALNIDPDKTKGYAWGVGIDRLTMLVYGIKDIRQMLDSDYRWIKNFGISTLP